MQRCEASTHRVKRVAFSLVRAWWCVQRSADRRQWRSFALGESANVLRAVLFATGSFCRAFIPRMRFAQVLARWARGRVGGSAFAACEWDGVVRFIPAGLVDKPFASASCAPTC